MTGGYNSGRALGGTIRGLLTNPLSLAMLLAAGLVAAGLFEVAAANRYDIAGAGSIAFRLDRLTGDVVPCALSRQEQGKYVVECEPGPR